MIREYVLEVYAHVKSRYCLMRGASSVKCLDRTGRILSMNQLCKSIWNIVTPTLLGHGTGTIMDRPITFYC